MQKVFLFLVLLIMIFPFSLAKSENDYKVIPENTDSVLRKLYSLKEPYSIENFEKYFNDSIKNKSYSLDMPKLKNYSGKIEKTIDNMPVIIPKGRFQMPVAQPDSSVKYFLLIKKPDNVKR